MSNAYPWTAWIWWSGGAMLGLLSLWILYWSLLKDRAKGKRRCPKCWYDMSATKGLRCSECGYEAKRQKKLFKTRRRWRWAFVAILVGLFSFGSSVTPKIQRDGWLKSTPTTAIIIAFPWLEERDVRGSWQAQLLHELKYRLANQTYDEATKKWNYEQLIPDWQWNLLIKQIANMDERIPSADSQNLRPGSFAFRNRYEFIKLAINLGLLQYLEPIGEISPHNMVGASLKVEVPELWYTDASIPCQTNNFFLKNQYENPYHLTVRMERYEESLKFEEAQFQPHGMYLGITKQWDDFHYTFWLANLPAIAKPGLAVFTFDIVYGVQVEDRKGKQYNFLPIGDNTTEVKVQLVGSIEETIKRDDDPDLDELLRESFVTFCSEEWPSWIDNQLVVF